MLDAGVPLDQITLSSDANVSMPVLDGQDQVVGLHNASPRILHREWLHIIRTNRLSLPQALPLVTSNVARVLGIDDHKGSLGPGKDADIVFLTEDLMVDTVHRAGPDHGPRRARRRAGPVRGARRLRLRALTDRRSFRASAAS